MKEEGGPSDSTISSLLLVLGSTSCGGTHLHPFQDTGTREFNHEIVRFGFQGPTRRRRGRYLGGLRSLVEVALHVNFFYSLSRTLGTGSSVSRLGFSNLGAGGAFYIIFEPGQELFSSPVSNRSQPRVSIGSAWIPWRNLGPAIHLVARRPDLASGS